MAFLASKKLGKRYIVPFILLLLVLSPTSLVMSFQFSTAFYVMFITMFVILLFDSRIKDVFHYCILFEIVGIATNYFDFLTYPAITLGVPLTLYILLHRDDHETVLSSLASLIKISASWSLGYAAMWGLNGFVQLCSRIKM